MMTDHKDARCGEILPHTHFGKLFYVHPTGATQLFALDTALTAMYFAKTLIIEYHGG